MDSLDDKEIADLWRLYGNKLREIARRHLGAGRPLHDSEDIANAAFMSLLRYLDQNSPDADHEMKLGIARDEFDHGIWPVALGIARNKALEANRRATAKKRGGDVRTFGSDRQHDAIDFGNEPSILASVSEQFALLDSYVAGNRQLREILQMRLEGFSSKEISKHVEVSEASVCRRLKELRRVLEEAS